MSSSGLLLAAATLTLVGVAGTAVTDPAQSLFNGRGEDPNGVYTVVEEDGEPAIRISGEIWGALVTRNEFEDYHLRLEYKWGEDRHGLRADAPRNTGVLYHSVGPDGAFWSYWMRSAEFEVMEGRTGDFTSVDGIEATIPTKWGLRHQVDGHETPLTRGSIQLQSEGAEVFFRRLELLPQSGDVPEWGRWLVSLILFSRRTRYTRGAHRFTTASAATKQNQRD